MGNGYLPLWFSTIKKWFKKFGEDDFDLNDKARSGRPQETKDVALQSS